MLEKWIAFVIKIVMLLVMLLLFALVVGFIVIAVLAAFDPNVAAWFANN